MNRSPAEIRDCWLNYGRRYAVHPTLHDGSVACMLGPLSPEGGTLRDYSGRTAGAAWSVGVGDVPKYVQGSVRGGAFWSGVYDGIDDHTNAGTSTSFDIGSADFTVSIWVKTSAASAAFCGKRNVTVGETNDGWVLYISGNKLRFLVAKDPTNYFATSLANVNTGTWHHCIGIRKANTVEAWLNGVGATAAGTAGSVTIEKPLCIGSQTPSAGFSNADICSFGLFHRSLTPNEIAILATHPLSAYEVNVPRYWSFATGGTHLWPWQIRHSRRVRGKR